MGSTINPRARGGASLSAQLRAERKDLEQQRRQRVVIPKSPAAPAAGGDPALSAAIVSASSASISDRGGQLDEGSLDFRLFGAPDWNAAPPWLSQEYPEYPVLASGWYLLTLELDVGWAAASAPRSVTFHMTNTLGDGQAWRYAEETIPLADSIDGTRRGIQRTINHGHAILDKSYPLLFTLDFHGGTPAGALSSLEGYGAKVNWYIARLGSFG